LERTNIILDIPWLQIHNSEINWEIREVKITKYLPICKRSIIAREDTEKRKKVERKIRAIEKLNRNK